jgi:polyhydroxyalkanoate synthesis repressor PhaR
MAVSLDCAPPSAIEDPVAVEPSSQSPSGVVLIKRYANRKLYNTATSRYITLKGIAELIEAGDEVRVIDNETGEDITSVTLSQILVDTERTNRRVPGTVLSDLIQRSGDVLYTALKKRVGDASEGFEELQRNMKKLLSPREIAAGKRPDWIALATPDLDRVVQRALERVVRALDLPRRADLEALEQRLDRVLEELGARPHKDAGPPATDRPADEPSAFESGEH